MTVRSGSQLAAERSWNVSSIIMAKQKKWAKFIVENFLFKTRGQGLMTAKKQQNISVE